MQLGVPLAVLIGIISGLALILLPLTATIDRPAPEGVGGPDRRERDVVRDPNVLVRRTVGGE